GQGNPRWVVSLPPTLGAAVGSRGRVSAVKRSEPCPTPLVCRVVGLRAVLFCLLSGAKGCGAHGPPEANQPLPAQAEGSMPDGLSTPPPFPETGAMIGLPPESFPPRRPITN